MTPACLRFLAFALAASVPAGCSRPAGGTSAGKPVVALVVKTLNNPYFIDMQRGAEEAARTHGLDLLVQAAEREIDVERQMQIAENLIQRRVSVLIIAPSGSREIIPVILKANRAGIPVIIVDTRADAAGLKAAGGRIATFIGSDNYEGGGWPGSSSSSAWAVGPGWRCSRAFPATRQEMRACADFMRRWRAIRK